MNPPPPLPASIPSVEQIDALVSSGRTSEAMELSVLRLVKVAVLAFEEAGSPLFVQVEPLSGATVSAAFKDATALIESPDVPHNDTLIAARDALEAVLQYLAVNAGIVFGEASRADRVGALSLAAGSIGQASAILWGSRLNLYRDDGAVKQLRSVAGKTSGVKRRARWWSDGAVRAVELAAAHRQWSVHDIAARIWQEMAGQPYRPGTVKGVRKALDTMAGDGDLVWPAGCRPAGRSVK